jgi:hypothetical protein
MQLVPAKSRKWSDVGLTLAIVSFAICIVLVIADGILHNPNVYAGRSSGVTMLIYWVIDFRFVFEQMIYAGTILFIGAKFIETRTIFTIGFDKLDADKVSMKGPDENNVVWIGHRYGTKLEADTVAQLLESRLKDDAA